MEKANQFPLVVKTLNGLFSGFTEQCPYSRLTFRKWFHVTEAEKQKAVDDRIHYKGLKPLKKHLPDKKLDTVNVTFEIFL